MSVFNALNILNTAHLSRKDKALMVAASPLMYIGFLVITAVEYVSLLKTLYRLPRLRESISQEKVTWVSPPRTGVMT